MTRGRIRLIDRRLYVDGYNLSSELRNIGSLDQNFDKATDDSVLLPVKKMWPAQGDITPGTANMLFDNTALTGTHIVLPTAGGMHNLALLQGIQAAPAAGEGPGLHDHRPGAVEHPARPHAAVVHHGRVGLRQPALLCRR